MPWDERRKSKGIWARRAPAHATVERQTGLTNTAQKRPWRYTRVLAGPFVFGKCEEALWPLPAKPPHAGKDAHAPSHRGAADVVAYLIHKTHILWKASKKKGLLFCSKPLKYGGEGEIYNSSINILNYNE